MDIKNRFLGLFPQLENDLINYKVHLATPPYEENDPLIVFLQGNFQDWQACQTKKNFERNYIVALIAFDVNEWLFAGIYKSISCKWIEKNKYYEYDTELMDINTDLIGRLIFHYERKSRQSYLYLENCLENFRVSQILKEKYSIKEFPGYAKTIIPFGYLQAIIKNNDSTWATALKNVKGVYLITDRLNGKKYVGSAYGEYAFWARWSQYSENGHGGNVELRKIIKEKGFGYTQNFQFSILEIRAITTDDAEIIEREKHWKNVLLTKEHGYNQN